MLSWLFVNLPVQCVRTFSILFCFYLICVSYTFSSSVVKVLTPPFGRYIAEELRLEGDFHSVHSRLIENSEQGNFFYVTSSLKALYLILPYYYHIVALFSGEEAEKNIVERAYYALIKHVNRTYRMRLWHGMVEDGIIKWLWGALGVSNILTTCIYKVHDMLTFYTFVL